MTIEEYKKLLFELEKEFEEKKKQLIIRYSKETRRYKIGDIIEDKSGDKIIVERIQASCVFGEPDTVYSGIELTKNRKPSLKRTQRSIYQTSIKS